MSAVSELGGFLASRRSRVTPYDVGVPVVGRRRVPGLRREEVAELAGVSVVYYTRLEQGRAANPSDSVLEALARVLGLNAAERAHLFDLAHRSGGRVRAAAGEGDGHPAGDSGRSADAVPAVREGVRRLLDAQGAVPAYVLDPAMDVLAANALAVALVGEGAGASAGTANLARHIFVDATAPLLYPEWDEVARQTVGFLRFSAGRHPGHPRLARLVAELSRHSPRFRELWAAQEVTEKTHGEKHFRHPLVGGFRLTYETLALPGDAGQSLVVFTAPDERADTALRLLGSWAAVSGPGTTDRTPDAGRP
ncbi:helix-turn-helix transcriptional regulator [Streptomyces sp. TRM49041]|uniref:helix-turn-helix domain-containing protein n=1 Tax=Streptomyces sp. TRM49041 TaxID=2603216 RepID=UPI0011EC9DF8|nr:helix-turn-helix transcriptional regulator [Streptomyces sp. TRM49041]